LLDPKSNLAKKGTPVFVRRVPAVDNKSAVDNKLVRQDFR